MHIFLPFIYFKLGISCHKILLKTFPKGKLDINNG
jgi:hypothetical protein